MIKVKQIWKQSHMSEVGKLSVRGWNELDINLPGCI